MNQAALADRTARVIAFYERLGPDDVRRLGEIYAGNAYFRDPFNEVRGLPEIERIFDTMFRQLADCRFDIVDSIADDRGLMLTWDMTFRIRSYRPATVQTIHGASHIKFGADDRIVYHRDYWDAAGELYAKLPVIGPVMRFLRKRLG